jgi:GntR family transcriptional regulator / MocR family aminotransferase
VPEPLVGPFADAKHAADGHTALLPQGVLAAFISEGHLAQHLRAKSASQMTVERFVAKPSGKLVLGDSLDCTRTPSWVLRQSTQ